MMDTKLIIEMIGYLGSTMVLVSMLMTSVVKLRVINLTGSIIFTGYAIAIHSYPTAVMNFCLAGINIYHLMRIFREEKLYTLVETKMSDPYFSYLLKDYDKDIRSFFPEYIDKGLNPDIAYLVCCDHKPAGLFMGRKTGDGEVEVLLDYATQTYRDLTVGKFIFSYMADHGYKTVVFRQKADKHVPYLEKAGFKRSGSDDYVLDLNTCKGDSVR